MEKSELILPIPHLKYHKIPCNGNLRLFNTKRMISTYQCDKCGELVKVIHGRSYKEIKEFEQNNS